MEHSTLTITADQRDGLYELVRNHLGSDGDLVDLLEQQKAWAKAEQFGLELVEDIRLMQDLGWGEDEGGEGALLAPSGSRRQPSGSLRSASACAAARKQPRAVLPS